MDSLVSALRLGTEVRGWVERLYALDLTHKKGSSDFSQDRARLGKLHPLLVWALGVWDALVPELVQERTSNSVDVGYGVADLAGAMNQLFGHLSALTQLRGSHDSSAIFKNTVRSIEFVLVGDTPPLEHPYEHLEPRKIETGLVGALNRAAGSCDEEKLNILEDLMRDNKLVRRAWHTFKHEVSVEEVARSFKDPTLFFGAGWVYAVTANMTSLEEEELEEGTTEKRFPALTHLPVTTSDNATSLPQETPKVGVLAAHHHLLSLETDLDLCSHNGPLPPLSAAFMKQKRYYEAHKEELQARYPDLWICIDGEAVVQDAPTQRELAAKLDQGEPRPDSFMVPTWNRSMPFIGEVQVVWLPRSSRLSARVQIQDDHGLWRVIPVKLDTGAELTTITPLIVETLGLRKISSMPINVASGHEVYAEVYKAELMFDGVSHPIYPPVMARALLGMDVLQRYTVFLGRTDRTCHALG
jgi:predicted aspartyl protease